MQRRVGTICPVQTTDRGIGPNLLLVVSNLPLDEFELQFKQEGIEHAGNPVYNVFLPALAKSRQAKARADVR